MPADGGGTTVPLSLFSGLDTELSVPDIPEGISPDNQDVIYLPGSVQSRPGLRKVLAAPLASSPTLVYQKTFVQPNENPLNLYLDSNGVLYQEDVVNSPGVFAVIQTIPDVVLQAQSVTAFGREYIAMSDGAHGSHVPLQYDGTFLDRVSQDGPGAAVAAGDEVLSYTIAAPGVPGLQIATNQLAITTITESGNMVTATLLGVFGSPSPVVGDPIVISGVPIGGYNGTFVIATINNVGGNAVIQYINNGAAGLGPSAGGFATYFFIAVRVTTLTQLVVGQLAMISGAGVAGYNGTYTVIVASGGTLIFLRAQPSQFGLANSGNGTLVSAGQIAAGPHQVVVMFLTRQGYITKPSPAAIWLASGTKRVFITNLPIGPANVVARILAFTGAGGDNFFYIPVTQTIPSATFGPPTVVGSTVIPDNTTTQVAIDFADNSLFAATSIDVLGRNYFAQAVLSDCIGVFSYASRMFWFGERNKTQNFLNMAFEGGFFSSAPTVPLGWAVETGGGALVNGGAWSSGMAWRITGDGTANPIGRISQPAFQDSSGIAILQPSTQYTFRCWADLSVLSTGSLIVEIFSQTSGVLATATININTISSTGGFVQADFNAQTPNVIPSDCVLRLYEVNLPNGVQLTLDELQEIFTENPFRDAVFRTSYVNAPEQFDGVTGVLGSTNDPSQIRCAFQLRNVMYFHTANGKHSTQDNGIGEPATWSVPEISQAVGAIGVHATDPGKAGTGESGEQWEFTASYDGLYIFSGGNDLKISQEIQTLWDSINKSVLNRVWVKNDRVTRRCYIGIPTGTATAPDTILVLDYRELNDAYAIANSPPIHISYSGKMIASDLSRKWTRWSLSMNCAEILARAGGALAFVLGAGNGQTPGTASGFGNIYTLDPAKLTDDDYGQITPYYTTYFFVSHDQEQALQLDSHRKLASYFSMFISGVGQTAITPLSDTLANAFPALPAYPLSSSQNHDYEWPINVTGERIAMRIGSVPNQGQTDNSFNIQKLTMTLKKEPIAPLRGAM